jgi:transposase
MSWRWLAAGMLRSSRAQPTSPIAESCLRNWLRDADVEDGQRPGQSRVESAELREANRRIRLLEQENEILRRAAAYLSQAHLPGRGSTRS